MTGSRSARARSRALESPQRRVLVAALVLSVAAHGVVATWLPALTPSPAPLPPLVVEFTRVPLPEPIVAEEPPPEPESPPPEPPRRVEHKPVTPQPPLPPAPQPAPAPAPVLAAPPSAAPSQANVAVPPVEQLKLPPQPAPPPEPQPAAEPVPLDPRLLKGFQNALAENARRYKRYPRRAMDEGWQGTVLVKLHVGASGRVQELLIDRSSGHEILDREAVEMVRKGAPLAALPPELRGRAVIVLVPVVFRLE